MLFDDLSDIQEENPQEEPAPMATAREVKLQPEHKPVRDAAFDAAGGFEELNWKAFQAGTTLQNVLDAKKVKDYDAAWADLQDTLGEFEADQARLQTAVEKYGFSLAELGPQLQASRLNDQAKELIEDWRVLVGAGVDVALVNQKMADAINEYLTAALSVGAEVPAAFRPVLEAMAKQGTLIDANGELITDLEDAGVTFAETMTQGFDRVVQKLDEMIQRLGLAGQAIANMPSVPSIDVGNVGGWGRSPDVLSPSDLPGYAGGTRGRYLDFKGGTPVMLHGRERVMTEGEQGSDGPLAAVAAALDGIDRRISTAVSRAVSDALILAPRR